MSYHNHSDPSYNSSVQTLITLFTLRPLPATSATWFLYDHSLKSRPLRSSKATRQPRSLSMVKPTQIPAPTSSVAPSNVPAFYLGRAARAKTMASAASAVIPAHATDGLSVPPLHPGHRCHAQPTFLFQQLITRHLWRVRVRSILIPMENPSHRLLLIPRLNLLVKLRVVVRERLRKLGIAIVLLWV